jgi:hypothetical protein
MFDFALDACRIFLAVGLVIGLTVGIPFGIAIGTVWRKS